MGNDTDPWRSYFRDAGSDIFAIIENGIRVAASDQPEEFRQRRGRLVEFMFSCKFCVCNGCHKCEDTLPVPNSVIDIVKNEDCEYENGNDSEERNRKEVDVAGDTYEGNEKHMVQCETNIISDEELEAFIDEVEQEHLVVAEVFRLKRIILDDQAKGYSIISETLMKLQSLFLTVDILRETGIGKVVNPLRRHRVEEIRSLAGILTDNWKLIVDAWVHASRLESTVKEKKELKKDESEDGDAPDSMNPPFSHENLGSNFPPVYEAAFMEGNQDESMELSKILDDIDECGNIINSDEMVVMSGNKRKLTMQKPSIIELKQMSFSEACMNNSFEQMDKQVNIKMSRDPDSAESATAKPARAYIPRKSNKPKSCRVSDDDNLSKRPKVGEGNRMEPSNKNAEEMKFEALKKKLMISYEQVKKANKHTVQIIDLKDLPKVKIDEKQEDQRHWRKQFTYRVKGRY
ncbi:hypothetical protein QQ045_005648 [Rhodiola kirilowii]